MWHRHEIENYLLDPGVVADAFNSLRTTVPRLKAGLPGTADEIKEILKTLAGPMIEHHAGWLAHARLQETLKLDTRIKGPSGKSGYLSRSDWLYQLKNECQRIRQEATTLAPNAGFKDSAVTQLYDEMLAEVSKPAFLSDDIFLADMEGKKIMMALLVHTRKQWAPRLTESVLKDELINALERVYAENYFTPDDFLDIANRLV